MEVNIDNWGVQVLLKRGYLDYGRECFMEANINNWGSQMLLKRGTLIKVEIVSWKQISIIEVHKCF